MILETVVGGEGVRIADDAGHAERMPNRPAISACWNEAARRWLRAIRLVAPVVPGEKLPLARKSDRIVRLNALHSTQQRLPA